MSPINSGFSGLAPKTEHLEFYSHICSVFSLICSDFILADVKLTHAKSLTTVKVHGVQKAIEQLGRKHAVLALFSFFKGSGKALFLGQNLLRKSSVLLFVFHFSTVGDNETLFVLELCRVSRFLKIDYVK